MLLKRRILSPAGYFLAACCFLLPFLGVSFDSPLTRGFAGWTGVHLTVGGQARDSLTIIWYTESGQMGKEETTIEAFSGKEQIQQFLPHKFLHSQALAIAAAILVLAGLLSGILAGERIQTWVAAVAGLGAAGTITLAEVRALDFTGPYTSPQHGFWLAVGMLTALGIINLVQAIRFRES